jgi:hypothetical protein
MFALWFFKKIFSLNLTFRIREILGKSSKHNKKCLIFRLNFFFNSGYKSTKKLYKMATSNFRLVDHIFCICSLKNHMTWFSDFWSKIIRNILKIFLISSSKIFKLIFLEFLAENIGNGYFHYI